MPRRPEIGSIQLYPQRPLRRSDKNGYVLKFYCPLRKTRIRKNCGTRDKREARRILLECRERLLNGDYVHSGGVITAQLELISLKLKSTITIPKTLTEKKGITWDECLERYQQQRSTRTREISLVHSVSRIAIAEKLFRKQLKLKNDQPLFINEVMKLDRLEALQDQLLAGEECRYGRRSPHTVNSTMAAVMAFVRFCHKYEWIDKVPHLEKLEAADKMKGRPITSEEFERMLEVTPQVVGIDHAAEWKLALYILWESGFRISDLMNFSWNDEYKIHPVWPDNLHHDPYLVIPPTQKNGKYQEVPMLPGLEKLLENIPAAKRTGYVVNLKLPRIKGARPSLDFVSRTIAEIGKQAGIIVVKENKARGIRQKYASAHDLRRGCAFRLINLGVSAETLKVVMRHADFGTTQKHYGAIKTTQTASREVREKLNAS